mgnify:CR=1 FL=1
MEILSYYPLYYILYEPFVQLQIRTFKSVTKSILSIWAGNYDNESVVFSSFSLKQQLRSTIYQSLKRLWGVLLIFTI